MFVILRLHKKRVTASGKQVLELLSFKGKISFARSLSAEKMDYTYVVFDPVGIELTFNTLRIWENVFAIRLTNFTSFTLDRYGFTN